MIDPIVLLSFIPASLALNLTPGADMMFCLGQGLRVGRRSAIAASAGISTGSMVHIGLAGVGLGAAVAAVPWLFDVIRWLGVLYLMVLAVKAFLGSALRTAGDSSESDTAVRSFGQGFLVNLFNPKVVLFVLAFVPQFVDPTGPILVQFLLLGLIMASFGFVINAGIGIFAGSFKGAISDNPVFARWTERISGTIFAGLAISLALSARKAT